MNAALRKLRAAAGLIRGRMSGKTLVLLYHRVATPGVDPWSIAVSPPHFAEHMAVLRKQARMARLGDFAAGFPSRSIVVTFDDGYSDNFENAKPIFEGHNIPATFFIASGYIGSGREFWWDEIEALFLHPGQLPPVLNWRAQTWNLGESSGYSQSDFNLHRYWKTSQPAPTPRHAVYFDVWKRLRVLPPDERANAIAQLYEWAARARSARHDYLPMSRSQLRALASCPLVEIGAHTVNHPALAALPLEMQRAEIEASRATLEQITGKPVQTFSYPFGGVNDYSADTVALVKASGLLAACTTIRQAATRRAHLLQIPRFYVPDCNGEDFSRLLNLYWTM